MIDVYFALATLVIIINCLLCMFRLRTYRYKVRGSVNKYLDAVELLGAQGYVPRVKAQRHEYNPTRLPYSDICGRLSTPWSSDIDESTVVTNVTARLVRPWHTFLTDDQSLQWLTSVSMSVSL